MYTVHFTTLSSDDPAASRQTLMLSSTSFVCRLTSTSGIRGPAIHRGLARDEDQIAGANRRRQRDALLLQVLADAGDVTISFFIFICCHPFPEKSSAVPVGAKAPYVVNNRRDGRA